jgi:hypothetical protein
MRRTSAACHVQCSARHTPAANAHRHSSDRQLLATRRRARARQLDGTSRPLLCSLASCAKRDAGVAPRAAAASGRRD